MRSREVPALANRCGAVAVAALFVAALSLRASAQPPVMTRANSLTQAEIAHALETVKADPNLATERTIRMLKWKDAAEPKRSRRPAWLTWITGLFRWIDQSARVLVWVAVVLLAAWLLVYLFRMVHRHRVTGDDEPFVAPTHVRDLDIRPETLPRDIGGAARALWDRGEHRAALALLYRGLLSRLAHVHRIPIRDSSTEGDCLALAARQLAEERLEYASRLVRVWQRAVYGHDTVSTTAVHGLCDEFASALDVVPPLHGAVPGNAS